MPPTNLVLIIADQLSAHVIEETDHVDLPALRALQAESVVFTEAHCTFPLCVPSRASMLTGQLPHQIAVMGNKPSAPFTPTLGHHLRDHGFRTGWAGKWHCPEPELVDRAGFEQVAPFGDIGLVDACETWLETVTEPFVLAVSFDDPHTICEYARGQEMPYGSVAAPRPEDCPPLPANAQPSPYEAEAVRFEKHDAASMYGTVTYSYDDWRRYRWVYRRLVERVDREVGRLLAVLDRLGLADDTHLVLTSDHGDGDGAHAWNQKLALFREVTRVPFVVRPAGRTRAGTVTDPVSVGTDLVPTLCSLLGVPTLPGSGADVLAPPPEWPEREVVIATLLGTGRPTPPTHGRALVGANHTYAVYGWGHHREQLHDHTDPGQVRNLAVESASRALLESYRRRLLDWCLATNDPFVRRLVLPSDCTDAERGQIFAVPY